MDRVALECGVEPIRVYEVATFYTMCVLWGSGEQPATDSAVFTGSV